MDLSRKSDVETRLCLEWTTERPYWNKERYSSTFSLMDSEWRLYLKIVTHRRYRHKTFTVVILKRENNAEAKLENSFSITTFIENSLDYSFPSLGFTQVVRSGGALIWLYEQEHVTRSIPLLNESGRKWRIVCLFHSDCSPVPKEEISAANAQDSPFSVSAANAQDSPFSVSPANAQDSPFSFTVRSSKRIDLDTAFIAPPFIAPPSVEPPSVEEPISNLESLSLDFSKLFKDEAFSDVKLRCGGRTIPAHRFVLTARSKVFADLLRSNMDETGVVEVTDLEPQVLDLLLKYLYSGKVQDLSKDTVLGLYAASDKHALHSLKKTCSYWMISNLTVGNSARYFEVADAHNDIALKEAATSFICNHEALLQSESWLRFFKKPSGLAAKVYQKVTRAKNKKLT